MVAEVEAVVEDEDKAEDDEVEDDEVEDDKVEDETTGPRAAHNVRGQ